MYNVTTTAYDTAEVCKKMGHNDSFDTFTGSWYGVSDTNACMLK